jgi:ABC-type cobalamin/Fe3+-siderophores transport system ATPase subunit
VYQGDFRHYRPQLSRKTSLLKILAGLGKNIRVYCRRGLSQAMAIVPPQIEISFSFSVADAAIMGHKAHLGVPDQEGKRELSTCPAGHVREPAIIR